MFITDRRHGHFAGGTSRNPPERGVPGSARQWPGTSSACAVAFCLACLLWSAPAKAISVDGIISPGEWSGAKVVITDPNEPLVSDDYDLNRILVEDGHHSLYIALTVYGTRPALAASGSVQPYLTFYFNLYAGGGPAEHFGLTYNDGYGFSPGSFHLIQYGGEYQPTGWRDLGTVQFAVDQAIEVAIPWTMLPREVTSAGPIAVQGLFFLYNVAPGDVNLDGRVNFADYQVLEARFGQEGGWSEGDFNLNGWVSFADYQILETHFGYAAAGGESQCDMFDRLTSVDRNVPLTNHAPEPMTMVTAFLAIGSLGAYLRRRNRLARAES